MKKYRKKPVVIEALLWTGENKDAIKNFVKQDMYFSARGDLYICTLEGEMRAPPGDYIIKGVNGEFYPCDPEVFEKTYELVKE